LEERNLRKSIVEKWETLLSFLYQKSLKSDAQPQD